MTDLSPDQLKSLRAVVGRLIPASDEFGVPGADDDLIFADILRQIGEGAPAVAALLAALDTAAGAPFLTLGQARQDQLLQATRRPSLMAAAAPAAQCYYRDDRVMRSLGLEPRPPFPLGFELEEGDWSLLDPVRARSPFWREA
jgi:hypothetical protein